MNFGSTLVVDPTTFTLQQDGEKKDGITAIPVKTLSRPERELENPKLRTVINSPCCPCTCNKPLLAYRDRRDWQQANSAVYAGAERSLSRFAGWDMTLLKARPAQDNRRTLFVRLDGSLTESQTGGMRQVWTFQFKPGTSRNHVFTTPELRPSGAPSLQITDKEIAGGIHRPGFISISCRRSTRPPTDNSRLLHIISELVNRRSGIDCNQ